MVLETAILTGALGLTAVLVPLLFWVLHDLVSSTPLSQRVTALQPVETVVADRYRELVLITAGSGIAGSLVLSSVVGLEPCPLCWWQRIFLYPIPLLAATALVLKDARVRLYIIPFAATGIMVSLYHYLVQQVPQLQGTGCGGATIACSTVQLSGYGFITIPWMSLTLFVTVLLLAWWFPDARD